MTLKKTFKPQINTDEHSQRKTWQGFGTHSRKVTYNQKNPGQPRFIGVHRRFKFHLPFSLLCSLRSLRLNRQFYKTNPNSCPKQTERNLTCAKPKIDSRRRCAILGPCC